MGVSHVGECLPGRGASAHRGCLPMGGGECLPRECLSGGVCPGGCLPRGLSARGAGKGEGLSARHTLL